jgi:hypothetical protein
MTRIVNFPAVLSLLSFFVLWGSAFAGAIFSKRHGYLEPDQREDFAIVQGAALTLLGLLIGFTFSMAISRYDQRKSYEASEANAIGTEYLRVGLLPPADAAKLRELLKNYLDQRVKFYTTRDGQSLRLIDTDTARVQDELWSTVRNRAEIQPNATVALAASGMNAVLDSAGFTQAAWWNRIPFEAWVLLGTIAVGCNVLVGYSAHRRSRMLLILPLAVSISFFLIADIESPRGGIVRVQPQNLVSLADSLRR